MIEWSSLKRGVQGTRVHIKTQIVQKCTFPVHSNRTLRLKLFAPSTPLYIFHFTDLKLLIVNSYIQKKMLYVNDH